MWWIVVVVVVVALAATYVTWLATRVDRLHARAAAARVALDAHLVRRAAAALALADVVAAPAVRAAAHAALAGQGADEDRPAVENDLTWALRELPEPAGAPAVAAHAEVVAASRRVALGRQVHDDLVRDARSMRRRRLVRLLRLTRRHREPGYFDVDDPMLPQSSPATTAG
jgi:hypothetical protein